ncbi:hypothetical protein niasHT_004551 [Heterodera trifolii]|uniref:CCHC-type domain-containing protein n=1 Tax=Heterodera trifolii TaxID=157864 RepID=A0ABD2M083_9BILA
MSIDQLCQIFSKMKLVDQQLHGDTEKSGDESKPNWEHHNFGWHIDQQLLHGGDVSVQRLLAMKPRKPPAKPSDPRCVCCHRCGSKGHLAAKCSSGGERCFCCGKLQLHSSDECPNRHPGSFGKGLKCGATRTTPGTTDAEQRGNGGGMKMILKRF